MIRATLLPTIVALFLVATARARLADYPVYLVGEYNMGSSDVRIHRTSAWIRAPVQYSGANIKRLFEDEFGVAERRMQGAFFGPTVNEQQGTIVYMVFQRISLTSAGPPLLEVLRLDTASPLNSAVAVTVDASVQTTVPNIGFFEYVAPGPPHPEPLTHMYMLVGTYGAVSLVQVSANLVSYRNATTDATYAIVPNGFPATSLISTPSGRLFVFEAVEYTVYEYEPSVDKEPLFVSIDAHCSTAVLCPYPPPGNTTMLYDRHTERLLAFIGNCDAFVWQLRDESLVNGTYLGRQQLCSGGEQESKQLIWHEPEIFGPERSALLHAEWKSYEPIRYRFMDTSVANVSEAGAVGYENDLYSLGDTELERLHAMLIACASDCAGQCRTNALLEPVCVGAPTPSPTVAPWPTAAPTSPPSDAPTSQPTLMPTALPTIQPTALPTSQPSANPTALPTAPPTPMPTAEPTQPPTAQPLSPTANPTAQPSSSPTAAPQIDVPLVLVHLCVPRTNCRLLTLPARGKLFAVADNEVRKRELVPGDEIAVAPLALDTGDVFYEPDAQDYLSAGDTPSLSDTFSFSEDGVEDDFTLDLSALLDGAAVSDILTVESSFVQAASTTPNAGVPVTSADEGTFAVMDGDEPALGGAETGGIVAAAVVCCLIVVIGVGIVLLRRRDAKSADANVEAAAAATASASISSKAADVDADSRFLIEPSEVRRDKKIGEGAFGVVYRGEWRAIAVAVKEVKESNVEAREALLVEAARMKKVRAHANIVTLYGVVKEENALAIVTEFCELGSLDDYMNEHGDRIQAATARSIALDICRGVVHLHAERVIHRDLAARNVLLAGTDADIQAKVADFGLARELASDTEEMFTKANTGPLKHMSPEAMRSKKYSERSDVFSLGVTLWEVLARSAPWPDKTAVEAAKAVLDGERMSMPSDTPTEVAATLRDCWLDDANARPTATQVLDRLEAADWSVTAAPGDGTAAKSSSSPKSPRRKRKPVKSPRQRSRKSPRSPRGRSIKSPRSPRVADGYTVPPNPDKSGAAADSYDLPPSSTGAKDGGEDLPPSTVESTQ